MRGAVSRSMARAEPHRVLGRALEPRVQRDDRDRRLPAAGWKTRHEPSTARELRVLGLAARDGDQPARARRLRPAVRILRAARRTRADRARAGASRSSDAVSARTRVDVRLAGRTVADPVPSAVPGRRRLAYRRDRLTPV